MTAIQFVILSTLFMLLTVLSIVDYRLNQRELRRKAEDWERFLQTLKGDRE